MALPWLTPDPTSDFPNPKTALHDPNGLLAVGGDLDPQRLINAYRQGIFPWYTEDQPILWWSPDPRMVFRTDGVRLSSRFRRQLRRCGWEIRADTAFDQVIRACAATPRPGQDGTWIDRHMHAAYTRLHRMGHAHSIEVFAGDTLAGGIYGVSIGRMFFGESMVSPISGGSKVALAALARGLRAWGWPLIDAQVENPHLLSLGAERWPRPAFLAALSELTPQKGHVGPWTEAFPSIRASDLAQA